MSQAADALMTPQEAADALGISTERVLQFARGGRLPHMKKGRYYFFERPVVEAFARQRDRRPGRPRKAQKTL